MVACWAEATPTANMHMDTCFYDRTDKADCIRTTETIDKHIYFNSDLSIETSGFHNIGENSFHSDLSIETSGFHNIGDNSFHDIGFDSLAHNAEASRMR